MGVEGSAHFVRVTGALTLLSLRGERGTTVTVRVIGPRRVTSVHLAPSQSSEAAHRESLRFLHDEAAAVTTVTVRFGAGPPFAQSQVLAGNWTFTSTNGRFVADGWVVPPWVIAQLQQRNSTYPVKWTTDDLSASWLSPGRLLLFLEATSSPTVSPGLPNEASNSALAPSTSVTATLDGAPIPTLVSYNCRGLRRPQCFNGFYFDLTGVQTGVPHHLTVEVGGGGLEALDLALVFDNVEPELTSAVGPAV